MLVDLLALTQLEALRGSSPPPLSLEYIYLLPTLPTAGAIFKDTVLRAMCC